MRYRFRRLNWCASLERCTCQAKARTAVSQLCCDGDLVSLSRRSYGVSLHEMPPTSSDWTARQPHAHGWLG
jgi:hypothetical protein